MAILGSLKVTLRYVFYFWIGIKKSPKANDNGAFLEFWLREQDLNLRPSGYEPDELPDCSIPRQLTRFILNLFSGSTEGRVLPSSILVCEPAELSDCSIPRQIFRGMALKRVALYVLPRRCQSLFSYIHFI